MIIKEKSIKSYVALERVLRYIFTKEGSAHDFVFKRFLKGDRKYEQQLATCTRDTEYSSIIMEQRIMNMKQQFHDNDKYRIHKRKGETKFYHCVISFHKADNLSRKKLFSVAKKYTKERFPKSIVVATNHSDTEHQHIHLVGSNVEYGLHTTRYLTRAEFKSVKQKMELWQDKEIGLVHSRVNHTKKKP
jgi:hypothetical protein